jgi:PAS domain S-box-containing protein
MSAAIRAFDWASTPFGPIKAWPANLRFALSLCEHASHAAAILWGPDYRLIYNDAFAQGPAARLPNALGVPAFEVFRDIWSTLHPQLEEVVATGRGFTAAEQMLPTMRDGVEEEICWSYSLTPIFGDDGKVAGIFSPGLEITRNVLADRRLSFQITLADSLRGLSDPEAMKQVATELLGKHLGAMRVGYAVVDSEEKAMFVQTEWTRDPTVESLIGRSGIIESFGPDVLAFLESQEMAVISDLRPLSASPDPGQSDPWDAIGVRSLIVVPLVREGHLKALLYVHESEPRVWRRSEAAIVRDVADRTGSEVARALAEKSLRESEDHYRHTVELNPQVTWTSLPSGQMNRVGPRWLEWTGVSGLGDSWLESLHPDDRERSRQAWTHSVASGKSYDIEHRVKHDDGYRWARSRAFPRFDDAGNILLWYGSTEDIHEQKMGEELQRLLINELNHRVKNTLATVQAIAFQTLKGKASLADAHTQFESRLLALSRAHNLLTERSWEGAQLHRVLADAMEHLAADQGRLAISGDPVWLAPRAALAFSLAFHELTTNAAKYGALSVKAGSISIDWSVKSGTLRLEWNESGGPPVTQTSPRGFGSRLIEKGLEADLGGKAQLLFNKKGVRCIIEASLAAIEEREEGLA